MKIQVKKSAAKVISLAMAAILITGTVGVAAYAAGANSDSDTKTKVTKELSAAVDTDRTVGKEETVYVLAGADGSAKKIIVSDWLKNTAGAASLNDETELQNAENVKSDAGYVMNPDNMRVWDANGEDIYYQGTIDKRLPVELKISYKLDGKAISAEDLAGKSGKVTMRFDYQNNQSQVVTVDGRKETIYVPFVMLTGMLLDNDTFTNVEVTNGKILNDGDRCAVMGFALPGMQENLGIDKAELELPSYVEVTADVQNFSLMTTLTVATNDLFNNLNLDNVKTLDDLSASLEELTNASNKLVDGSSTLYTGLSTLLDKSGALIAGIDQLYAGAQQLKEGAGTLQSGSAELDAGLTKLHAGLKTLTSNNDNLNAGAKQVFDSLLSLADSQLAAAGLTVPKLTIENYQTVLSGVLQSLDQEKVSALAYNTALEKVTSAVREQEETVRAAVTEGVRAKALEGVLEAVGQPMTAEEYAAAVSAGMIPEATQAQVEAAVNAQMETAEMKAQISSLTEAKIQELIDAQMQSDDVQAQISAAIANAQAGAASIKALLTQLDSYAEFYAGVQAYTAGAADAYAGAGQLSSGAGQLSSGAAQLADGAGSLYDGIGSLKSGSAALVDGVGQLQNGAMQLSDGMKAFHQQGVQKLVDAVDGDLGGLVARLRATVDVSKSYQSFAGKAEGTSGSVKFIYRTDSIGE